MEEKKQRNKFYSAWSKGIVIALFLTAVACFSVFAMIFGGLMCQGFSWEELTSNYYNEKNYLETQEGRNLPVVHCVKNTPGWELNEKVAAALRDAKVIDKPTFGSRALAEELEAIAAKEEIEVTLVGLCTDICVVSNALLMKAYVPEIPVRVIASCCAGVTPESHETALNAMKMCQIEIV